MGLTLFRRRNGWRTRPLPAKKKYIYINGWLLSTGNVISHLSHSLSTGFHHHLDSSHYGGTSWYARARSAVLLFPLALRNVYYLVFRRGCELDSELLLFTNRLWRGLFRAARATGETKSRSGWKWRRIADIYIYIFIFIRIWRQWQLILGSAPAQFNISQNHPL